MVCLSCIRGRACAAHKPVRQFDENISPWPPQTDRSCAEKHTERDTSSVIYKNSIRGTRRVPAVLVLGLNPRITGDQNAQAPRDDSALHFAIRILFTIGAGIWRKIRFLFVLLLTLVQKENKLKT